MGLHKLAIGPLEGPQAAFNGCVADLSALGWAFAAVSSRAFRLVDSEEVPPALLPVMDLADHDLQPNVRVAGVVGGGVKLVALRELHLGEEVINSYGELPNDFLLLDYGFVIEDNPLDRVALRFDIGFISVAASAEGVTPEDAAPWQVRAFARLGLESDNREVLLGGPALGSAEAGSREVDVLRVLAGLCAETLQRYPTSLEEDEVKLVALGVGAEDAAMRAAVNFRATKKRLLRRTEAEIRRKIK